MRNRRITPSSRLLLGRGRTFTADLNVPLLRRRERTHLKLDPFRGIMESMFADSTALAPNVPMTLSRGQTMIGAVASVQLGHV